jgi:KDO2-lipid IV(A) lauroyltransferase
MSTVSKLSLPQIHRLGCLIGGLFYRLPNGMRECTRRNLAACLPEVSAAERERLARRSLEETWKTLLEFGAMWSWPLGRIEDLLVDVQGFNALRTAFDAGQGVLVATPHLGAWELSSLVGGGMFPLTSMYRPPRLRAVENWLRLARERGGAKLAPANAAGVRMVMQALKAGEMVGILPDQEPPQDEGGVFAPFFGVRAYTMSLFARLAAKRRPALFIVYVERLPEGRGYVGHIEPLPEAVADDDPTVAAAALNAAVEACIRRCPEQYLWSYRRFKYRPEGAPAIY